MTAELCKDRITALALSIWLSSFLSCLLSLVNVTPRYLNFSTCFSVELLIRLLATRTNQGFLKNEPARFWPCLFSFRRCDVHLQSYLMRAGGQILWKKAKHGTALIASHLPQGYDLPEQKLPFDIRMT